LLIFSFQLEDDFFNMNDLSSIIRMRSKLESHKNDFQKYRIENSCELLMTIDD